MSGVIALQTEIPGPKSRAQMARRAALLPRGVSDLTGVVIDHGAGAVIVDIDGNRLLDFASGIGVLGLGHAHPAVTAAVQEQAGRSLHGCVNVTPDRAYFDLAERLARLAPIAGPAKVFLANSGAEAVENAVKLARAATGRPSVVVFEHGFHGRTLLALTMTSKVTYKKRYAPLAPEVYRVPYPYCYRCPFGQVPERCALECASYLEQHIEHAIGADQVAAIVIEPVAGEGGFIPAPEEFLRRAAALAARIGALLVVDEIQTGMGRCGQLFAIEASGVKPDIVTTAKALASGMPLSAVLARAAIADVPDPGGLGGTYGGNPVACQAALATLDTIESQKLVERARALGERITAVLERLHREVELVGDVRGRGAMRALELVEDRKSKQPAKERTQRIIQRCLSRGLILITAGTYGNVIRILVPLIITDAELDEGLAILEAAVREEAP